MKDNSYYNKDYFDWQAPMGAFGGWAELPKFQRYIKNSDTVLDFGCGGGYVLKNLDCAKRFGIEINPSAAAIAKDNGLSVRSSLTEIEQNSIDVVISNHALEHVNCPLEELLEIRKALKPGGKLILVVPCETIANRFESNDVNKHLYTWSPMCLGNLMCEAGFESVSAEAYIHRWPPKYRFIAKIGGRVLFELLGKLYARISRDGFQVRAIGVKPV